MVEISEKLFNIYFKGKRAPDRMRMFYCYTSYFFVGSCVWPLVEAVSLRKFL